MPPQIMFFCKTEGFSNLCGLPCPYPKLFATWNRPIRLRHLPVILMIYNYFSVSTLRNKSLKEFYSFVGTDKSK